MNIVQIGNKLREMPISVLHSEDIVRILGKVNEVVPDELKITAQSTGDDIYKLFNSADATLQTVLLEEVFNNKRESVILSTIMDEYAKRSKKESVSSTKWTTFQGSIVLLGLGALTAIVWSFLSDYGTKPPVPDAVVGNLITELLHTGVQMLIEHFENQS